jgi:hypothetical protein
MRNLDGDKIIVARGLDGHWVYFSVRDDLDNGSIIDFVQKRERCSLGHVRKALREWRGGNVPSHNFVRNLLPTTKNRTQVIAAYGRMNIPDIHPYLEKRAVGKEILKDRRFEGRIKIDQKGNAVFPHFDKQGLCGYEIKNTRFTGFSPGGDKGLWASHSFPDDTRLVIAESAIDALSFHHLHGNEKTRYVSTAGGWSPETPSLLRYAVEKLPGDEIVLAFDNDTQGYEYESLAKQCLSDTGKALIVSFPTAQGKDWNDILQEVVFPVLLKKEKIK